MRFEIGRSRVHLVVSTDAIALDEAGLNGTEMSLNRSGVLLDTATETYRGKPAESRGKVAV